MNHCSIWNRSVFVLNPVPAGIQNYGVLSRAMHEEREMVIGNIQLLITVTCSVFVTSCSVYLLIV